MKLIAFVLALLPILWLMLALGVLKKPAFKACPIALVVAVLLALTYWKMPVKDCVTGGLEGVAMAIWPVSLVIIAQYLLTTCVLQQEVWRRSRKY